MAMVNKFLRAVCLSTDMGLCLPFRRKKSVEWIWVLVKSLAKYKVSPKISFYNNSQSPVRGQGGKLAPTHLLAFPAAFKAFPDGSLEPLVLHVNQGKHSLTLNSWAGMRLILEWFAQLCHDHRLRRLALQTPSTHVAWGFILLLAWCCAQSGQCTAKILQPLSSPAESPALKEASVV